MAPSPEHQAISNASDAELILICAAAAERGKAFLTVLGPPELLDNANGLLGIVWAAAAGQSVRDECAEALDAFALEPEDDEDDTESPEFYVTQSMELIGNALAVSLRPSVKSVEMSINAMRSLLSMLDFKLSGESPVVVKYGEDAPPPGPLVEMEINAERQVIGLLGEGDGTPSVVDRVREGSDHFAVRLAAAVEEFAERNGWQPETP